MPMIKINPLGVNFSMVTFDVRKFCRAVYLNVAKENIKKHTPTVIKINRMLGCEKFFE